MKKCFDCGEFYLGLNDDDPCPNCRQNVMPDRERERLDQEFDQWLDNGAFDPANEILDA